MGNSGSQEVHRQKELDVDKYRRRRPELTQEEVLGLANMFDSMEPRNGRVPVYKIKDFFKDHTQDLYLNIKSRYRNNDEITFDDYFDLFAEDIARQKRKYKNVNYDSTVTDVSCGFCPFPTYNENRDSYRAMSKNL